MTQSRVRRFEGGRRLYVALVVAIGVGPGLAAAAWPQAAPGASPAPTLSPEQQKRMEAWVRAMTPGAPHRWLAARAGKFDFAGKFWMEPGAPPQVAKGVAERTLQLGGRVLQERVTSNLMGMPLDGLGLAGYDNVSGQYWSTWNDSLSTGLRVAGGSCDAAGTACSWRGTYSDPDSGKSRAVRLELRLEGADHEVLTAFEAGVDGKEARTMELVYTRKKP